MAKLKELLAQTRKVKHHRECHAKLTKAIGIFSIILLVLTVIGMFLGPAMAEIQTDQETHGPIVGASSGSEGNEDIDVFEMMQSLSDSFQADSEYDEFITVDGQINLQKLTGAL